MAKKKKREDDIKVARVLAKVHNRLASIAFNVSVANGTHAMAVQEN